MTESKISSIVERMERNNDIIKAMINTLEDFKPINNDDIKLLMTTFGHQLPEETFVFWATKEISNRVNKK